MPTYPVTIKMQFKNDPDAPCYTGYFREMGARTDAEVHVWVSDAEEILAEGGECTAYINSPPTEGSLIQISPESDRVRQARTHTIWRPAKIEKTGKRVVVTIE